MNHSMKHARNNKGGMKHAIQNIEGMKHAGKPEEREKKKINFKGKAMSSVFAGLALLIIVAVVVIYFKPITGFIDSNISSIRGLLFAKESKESEEPAVKPDDEDIDKEINNENKEGEQVVAENQNNDNEKEDGKESGVLPTIELEVYEGPLYAKAGDVCYYRVKANVTGDPLPEISFSIDDSLGSLGPDKAQINISRDSGTAILTAVAENSTGKATDTLTLVWNCNASPEIKGISISSNTLYVGKQYDVSVDAIDPDGDTLSYSWSVSDGSIVDSTVNPAKWNAPATTGDYQLSVTVNDGKGNSSKSSIAAYVGEVTLITEDEEEESSSPESLSVPKKEGEGGYVEYGGVTSNGGVAYAGDSANNKSCKGFISFNISELDGYTVQSASLTLSGANVEGDPLSAFELLNINLVDWGAEPITQADYNLGGVFIASYDSPGITCNVSKLKEELQKAINGGKSRFQIRIHFSGPQTDNDGDDDGWRYSQGSVNLNVTVIK
jgi:hypothetical protein